MTYSLIDNNSSAPVLTGMWGEHSDWEFFLADVLPVGAVPAVVFGVCFVDNQVALVEGRRGWGLPGGHIEVGEDPEQALHREIKEELNVTVTTVRMIGFQVIRNRREFINKITGEPYPELNYAPYYLITVDEPIVEYQEEGEGLARLIDFNDPIFSASKTKELVELAHQVHCSQR